MVQPLYRYRRRRFVDDFSMKISIMEQGKLVYSMKILSLLGLIVLACWWATVAFGGRFRSPSATQNLTKAAKNRTDAVTVTVYYETYCPDCENFILEHLYPVHAIMREKVVIDLVPYGKAVQSQVNGQIEFQCQHGKIECDGNKLHACAVRVACGDRRSDHCPWDQRSRLMEFVYCNLVHEDHVGIAEQCAEMAGLDADEVMRCANSREGALLLSSHGNRTDAYRPSIGMRTGSVPSIALDGVPSGRAESDLQREICQLRPSLC